MNSTNENFNRTTQTNWNNKKRAMNYQVATVSSNSKVSLPENRDFVENSTKVESNGISNGTESEKYLNMGACVSGDPKKTKINYSTNFTQISQVMKNLLTKKNNHRFRKFVENIPFYW